MLLLSGDNGSRCEMVSECRRKEEVRLMSQGFSRQHVTKWSDRCFVAELRSAKFSALFTSGHFLRIILRHHDTFLQDRNAFVGVGVDLTVLVYESPVIRSHQDPKRPQMALGSQRLSRNGIVRFRSSYRISHITPGRLPNSASQSPPSFLDLYYCLFCFDL